MRNSIRTSVICESEWCNAVVANQEDSLSSAPADDWLIIPSLGTGGPYPQQRWSKET